MIDNEDRGAFALAYFFCAFSGAIVGFAIGLGAGWALWD